MKLIDKPLQSPIIYSNVRIETISDTLRLTVADGVFIEDDDKYITKFIPELVDMNFDSVLIGGIFLGLVPYYIQQTKQYTTLTVVEKDINIINAVSDLNIFDGTVNIIHEDFLTYTPSQNYDLIISDTHWGHPDWEPNREQEVEEIKTKYISYLNLGGTLLIPLSKYAYTK